MTQLLINCKDTWNIPQKDGSFKRVKMNQLSFTQCKAANIIVTSSKKEIINGHPKEYLLKIISNRLIDIKNENDIIDRMINDIIKVNNQHIRKFKNK
jgi:hypothetical protein